MALRITSHENGGMTGSRRWISAVTIALGVVVSVLGSSMINLALPKLTQDLGVDAGTVIWVVKIYLLATVIALLPMAALGDLIGHRRVYLGGMLLFTFASLGCALSDRRGQEVEQQRCDKQ